MSIETHIGMRSALSPSKEFDDMNREMIRSLLVSLDTLQQLPHQPVRMGLMHFIRSHVSTCTTDAVYGPQNPFRDQAVIDAFWQFQRDLTPLLIGVLPSITARKGIAGRALVAKAMEQYYRNKGHESGSALARSRYEIALKSGLSVEDTALLEIGGVIAIIVNTVPAAFWTLFFIYATPGLLDDIRREVQAVVTTRHSEHGVMHNVDIKSLKQQCPLLVSTFQETLRHRAIGVSVRRVMEDTVLDDQWLLKKGSILQMPSRIIHKDQSLWGSNVNDFSARRFVKDQKSLKSGGSPNIRAPAAAFRGFGGGTVLCPGRHFATNEVLVMAAMFVLRYDMAPAAGSWSMPSTKNSSQVSFFLEPDSDVEVEVSLRKGYEEASFACGLKESDEIIAVTAEDSVA